MPLRADLDGENGVQRWKGQQASPPTTPSLPFSKRSAQARRAGGHRQAPSNTPTSGVLRIGRPQL